MTKSAASKIVVSIAGLSLLAGCSGATYGTGVSQEKQLLEDLSSMVSVGGKKKERINYQSRSKLVKAPDTGTLPPPAEGVASDSAYFPQDPDSKRNSLRAAADEFNRTGVSTPELEEARSQAAARGWEGGFKEYDDRPHRPEQTGAERRAARQAVLQARAERNAKVGAGPRKYLTQPPAEYRTPAETAEVGQVGEKEGAPNKPKKQSLLSRLTGAKKAAGQ